MSKIEIPFKNTDQILEIELEDLWAAPSDIKDVLRGEDVSLEHCLRVALIYYQNGYVEQYKSLLDESYSGDPQESPFQLAILNSLAGYFISLALNEKDKSKANQLFEDATLRFNEADKIDYHEENTWLGKGVLLLAKRNYDSASYQFNTVLQKNPNNIPAILGQACISFIKKEYHDALKKYAKCLKWLPSCPASVRLALGYCYYKLGYLEEASLCFRRVLQLDNGNVNAMIGLAILELNKKDENSIVNGLSLLKKSYELCKTNPATLNYLANYFFGKKDYTKAKALASSAYQNSELDDVKAESAYILGKVCHMENRLDDAFHYYYQSTQLKRDFLLPLFGLGQMHIKKNEFDEAIKCFETILEKEPENYECLKVLGSLLSRKSKHLTKAIDCFKKVTSSYPEDIEAWLEYATILEQSEPEEALRAYKEAIRQLSDNNNMTIPLEVLNNIAVLQLKCGHFCEAIESFQGALKECEAASNPDDSYFKNSLQTIKFNLARVYEEQNNYEAAEQLHRDILKNNPKYIDSYLRIGIIFIKKGLYNEATDLFKDAIGVDEQCKDAWGLLAQSQMETKAITSCRKTLERILTKNDKHDLFALLSLGNIYYQIARHEVDNPKLADQNINRSIEFFQKALSLNTNNFYAANGIGIDLAAKGHFKEARDVFLQVRQAEGSFDDIWINLGHVHMEMQLYNSAINMYEHCGKLIKEKKDAAILVYLAKAYYYFGKEALNIGHIEESIKLLEQASLIQPSDLALKFNIALNKQELGLIVSKRDPHIRTEAELNKAIESLTEAAMDFKSLVENAPEGQRFFDINVAKHRAKYCSTFITSLKDQLELFLKEKAEAEKKNELLEEKRRDEENEKIQRMQEEEELKRKENEEIERIRKEAAIKAKELHEKIKIEERLLEEKKKSRKAPKEEDSAEENYVEEQEAEQKKKRKLKKRKPKVKEEEEVAEETPSKKAFLSNEFVSDEEDGKDTSMTDLANEPDLE